MAIGNAFCFSIFLKQELKSQGRARASEEDCEDDRERMNSDGEGKEKVNKANKRAQRGETVLFAS